MKKFDFELHDDKTPAAVIQEAIAQIEQETQGHVKGCISPYTGEVTSYTKTIRHHSLLEIGQAAQPWEEEERFDVQTTLGEQDEHEYKFEVFLTVKGLPAYKYRLMFVRYGSISYPALLVLNDDLAGSLEKKWNTLFKVESMKQLQDLLESILRSEFIAKLIQNLIYESLRQEKRKLSIQD